MPKKLQADKKPSRVTDKRKRGWEGRKGRKAEQKPSVWLLSPQPWAGPPF